MTIASAEDSDYRVNSGSPSGDNQAFVPVINLPDLRQPFCLSMVTQKTTMRVGKLMIVVSAEDSDTQNVGHLLKLSQTLPTSR